ncbi:putative transcriptional regulator, GntR family [Thalassotalea sp. ND16A]|nr:putative transcriptional regulator, GntR family [Thalassotalea sp. ND16A]
MLLYLEIRQYLFTLIAQQPKTKKLPSERELVDTFKSTRITVREALISLEAEGMIYRLKRKGWFICPPRLQWDPIQKVNFYQLAQEHHFIARTQLISIKKINLTNDISLAFSRDSTSPSLYEICRVRSLDDRPVMVEEIYCQVEQFHGLDDKALEGSITTIFTNDYGIEVTKESSTISVTTLPENKAQHLQLNSGASCLKIIRKRFSADASLVDYNIEYWVHSAIEIAVESS